MKISYKLYKKLRKVNSYDDYMGRDRLSPTITFFKNLPKDCVSSEFISHIYRRARGDSIIMVDEHYADDFCFDINWKMGNNYIIRGNRGGYFYYTFPKNILYYAFRKIKRNSGWERFNPDNIPSVLIDKMRTHPL